MPDIADASVHAVYIQAKAGMYRGCTKALCILPLLLLHWKIAFMECVNALLSVIARALHMMLSRAHSYSGLLYWHALSGALSPSHL